MPSFEKAASNDNLTKESLGPSLYDKIVSTFITGNERNCEGRAKRASIGFKTDVSYEAHISSLPSGLYQVTAGTDLSSIFYPFETRIGTGNLPSFNSTVSTTNNASSGNNLNIYNLLPFYWNAQESGYVYDRVAATSGDALTRLISGNNYFGSSSRYRDVSKIRSVGLRLPLMGVGWGYTTSDDPWPSGASSSGSTIAFKGGYTNGWQVDPKDYVAAPIDLRYDTRRNVWVSPESARMVKITGTNYGPLLGGNGDLKGGVYAGVVWNAKTQMSTNDMVASGTGVQFTESNIGISGIRCFICNGSEMNTNYHDLYNSDTHSKIFPAFFVGYVNSTIPAYFIDGIYWIDCNASGV